MPCEEIGTNQLVKVGLTQAAENWLTTWAVQDSAQYQVLWCSQTQWVLLYKWLAQTYDNNGNLVSVMMYEQPQDIVWNEDNNQYEVLTVLVYSLNGGVHTMGLWENVETWPTQVDTSAGKYCASSEIDTICYGIDFVEEPTPIAPMPHPACDSLIPVDFWNANESLTGTVMFHNNGDGTFDFTCSGNWHPNGNKKLILSFEVPAIARGKHFGVHEHWIPTRTGMVWPDPTNPYLRSYIEVLNANPNNEESIDFTYVAFNIQGGPGAAPVPGTPP